MNKLFSEFKPISKNEWKSNIEKDLRRSSLSLKSLNSKTEDIIIEPIYHSEDNQKIYQSEFPSYWEVYQLIDATEPKKANLQALNALENDVSGLCFSNPNNLHILLKNISIEHIRIDFSNYSNNFQKEWISFTKNKKTQGAFHGETNYKIPNYFDTIFANGTAREQINSALDKGLKSLNQVQFHFKISTNYFLEIAKLKAFRILWKSKTGKNAYIFATNDISKNQKDKAYNNIIRSTTQCMSAIFGGANAIMLQSYNSSFEKATNFSERISRNQQVILKKESYLDKVEDPTKGSYYVEYLIKELLKEFEINIDNLQLSATKNWISASTSLPSFVMISNS